MVGIDHLIGPGEVVVYRARFGAMRVLYEAIAVAIGLGVGMLTGPGVLLAILFLGAWFYSERGLQKIVVTNQRVIHKQGWIRPRVDEIALSQVESIKNNGQRIVIIGSGGTKLKLPAYIADEAGLGRAIRQGRMGPHEVVSHGAAPVFSQVSEVECAPVSTPAGNNDANTSKPPLWKRPAFIVIACLLGWPFLVMPFVAEENVFSGAAGDAVAPSMHPTGLAMTETVANEPASAVAEAALADDPGALPEAVLTVMEADTLPYARRSIVVRLAEEVDKAAIIEIGKLLQAEAPRYRSTYVDFYLPQMVEGAGAWASLHLERGSPPELLGFADTSSLGRGATEAGTGRNIVGKWRDDRPYVKSLMVIRETSSGALLTRTFADGEVMEQILTERKANSGRRFDIEPEDGEGYGEYLLLRADGALAFYDNDGLIFVTRKEE